MNNGFAKRYKDSRYSRCARIPCAYCGVRLTRDEATVDHVVPRSLGGSNYFTNLRIACRRCNESKNNSVGWDELS